MKRFFYSFFVFVTLVSVLCLPSCKERPSKVEQRKEEIRRNDCLELAQAQKDWKAADSVATFKALELEDLKKQFVFEKQAKYQTTGYYVLQAYKGSKERFTFFPEVEEGGKLLLVSIDQKRRYSFVEVDLEKEDYTAQLPKGLSAAQKKDVAKCHLLAKTMYDLADALKQKEKMELKVRFYEEKRKKSSPL